VEVFEASYGMNTEEPVVDDSAGPVPRAVWCEIISGLAASLFRRHIRRSHDDAGDRAGAAGVSAGRSGDHDIVGFGR